MLDKLIYKFFEGLDNAVSFVETRVIKISEWCWSTRVKLLRKKRRKNDSWWRITNNKQSKKVFKR